MSGMDYEFCVLQCNDTLQDSATCELVCTGWLGPFVLATYIALIIAVLVLSIILVICCCCILKRRWTKKKYTIQSTKSRDASEDRFILQDVQNTTDDPENMKEGSYDLLERPETLPNSAPDIQDEPMDGMYDMIIETSSSKHKKGEALNVSYNSSTDKTKSTSNDGLAPPPAPAPPPLITTPQSTSAIVYAAIDKTKKTKKSPMKFSIPSTPPTTSAVATYEDVTGDDYDVLQRDFTPPISTETNKKTFYNNVPNPTTSIPLSKFDALYDTLAEETPQIQNQDKDLTNMENQYDVVNL